MFKLLLKKNVPNITTKVWKFFHSGVEYKNNNFQSNLITVYFNVFLFYQDNTSLVWGAIHTLRQEFLQEIHRLDQKVIGLFTTANEMHNQLN